MRQLHNYVITYEKRLAALSLTEHHIYLDIIRCFKYVDKLRKNSSHARHDYINLGSYLKQALLFAEKSLFY